MVRIQVFLIIINVIIVNSRYLTENATSNVEEIQHAVCKIDTEEIKATANASITRQLKGVCSTKALNSKFNELVKILKHELQNIKIMLQSVGYTTPRTHSYPTEPEYEDYDYLNEVNFTQANLFKNIQIHETFVTKNNSFENGRRAQISKADKRASREIELLKLNGTIQEMDNEKVFLYFWKIYEINEILKQDIYLISPTVNFLQRSFNIKFTSNFSGYSRIEIIPSRFLFKTYRFVLIHDDAKQDMNSQLLGNYATLFSVSQHKLENFIIENALLIKLIIYLN